MSCVREAVERAVPPGRGVLAALSGGLDSVCLVHALRDVATESGFAVEVAHVDHGLRPGSAEDAAFCGALAQRMGLPFHAVRLDPVSFVRGKGVQAEARRQRRRWLEGVMQARALAAILLAHHADDQIETVLYRLLRGSGPRGLGGMEEWAPPYLRPLLAVRRAQLEFVAKGLGWDYRTDPTNRQTRYARNLLRLHALPVLRSVHPGADEAVLRAARLLAEDDRHLSDEAARAWSRLAVAEPEGFRVAVEGLVALPAPLRRRLYLAGWAALGCETQALEARHLEAIDRMLSSKGRERRAPVPGPGAFVVGGGSLWIVRAAATEAGPLEVRLQAGGWSVLRSRGALARWDWAAPPGHARVGVPAGRGVGGVVLRSWRPGDRLERDEGPPIKVAHVLGRERLPRWRRCQALVVEDRLGTLGVLAAGSAWGLTAAQRGWVWLEEGAGGGPPGT